MEKGNPVVPAERIEKYIVMVRKQEVMLDSGLAELYGVQTKVLNQAVSRNPDRFPEDYLKSQVVTSSLDWGGGES